jgi:outer membrane receptor protein involved in Fe transport
MTRWAQPVLRALALGTLLAPVAPVLAGPADAPAAADSGALEQIVVTAQRRTERLQDVPMSITTFSEERIDQQGLRTIDDLSRLSPGLTFIRNGMSSSGNYNDEDSDISIRGIDSTAGASTIGIYVDDTPIQTRHLQFGTVNPYPALFDLERVEVLKGPQGTLFGAGSEGGTIRFITPQPSLHDWQVYARSEFGQIEGGGQNYEAGLAVGGPIIEGVLGFRASVSFREDGGWVNRVGYTAPTPLPPGGCNPAYCYGLIYPGAPTVTGTTEKNANWHDTQTARLAFKWQPTDELSVEPSVYVQTLHINDTGAFWLNISNPSDNVYNNGNIQRDPSTDPWYLGAIKVDWNQPFAHIASNTSYFSRSQHSISDYTQWYNTVFNGDQYDKSPVSALFADRQDNFTEEVRASSANEKDRLTWNAGVFYSHVHENTTEYIYDPPPNTLIYDQPQFDIIDKQIAVFGEVNFKFTDTWNFTAGTRFSKVDYTGQANQSGKLIGIVVHSTNSGNERPVTPRFVLNYKPSSDSLYYASAAKGFRPGGVNSALPPACTANLPAPIPSTFSADSLWQYELGTKQTLAENRLQVNASVYYLKWNNIQQFVYLVCGLGFVPNLGEVTGKGGDIEISWRATEALTLSLNGAYTDSYYDGSQALKSNSGSVNLVSAGNHLPASPWNFNATAEYVLGWGDKKPYLRLDYQYTTPQRSLTPYLDQGNAPNSDATLPGLPNIRLLQVRGGLRFSGVDLSLFVQNALNYHTPYFVSRDLATTPANGYADANGSDNFDTNYFGRGFAPRTYGVTATYRY